MSQHPKILYQFEQSAGKPFQPSNGTEGMIFIEHFCEQCIHEKFMHTQCKGDRQCNILDRSLVYQPGDEQYPQEWVYSEQGWPLCTKWKHWDWGGDDWRGDGINEPPPEPVNDPNQLMFPFMISEIIETETIEELVGI